MAPAASPEPAASPSAAEAVDRLHHHEDEQERAGHVERPIPVAEAPASTATSAATAYAAGQAVGVVGAPDRDPDDGEQQRAERDQDGQVPNSGARTRLITGPSAIMAPARRRTRGARVPLAPVARTRRAPSTAIAEAIPANNQRLPP